MLYQPKVIPTNELSIVREILKKQAVKKAFYSKISISFNKEIMDYHLVGLDCDTQFVLNDLILDFNSNKEELKDLKFLDLSINNQISPHIRRNKPFYSK